MTILMTKQASKAPYVFLHEKTCKQHDGFIRIAIHACILDISARGSSTFCKIGHVLTCTLLGYSVSFQRRRDSPCVRRCWRCRRTDSSVAWHDPPHPPLPVRCGCLPGSEKTREMHCLVLHVKIMLKTLTDEVDSAKCNAFKGIIQTGPYKNSWHNKKHGSCKTEIETKCSYQASYFSKLLLMFHDRHA